MATGQRGKKGSHQTTNNPAKNPPHFFKVVLSSVGQGIRIPTAFMREHGESLKKVVWLKVPTGASWPVALLQTDVGTWLRKGWREFAEYYTIDRSYFLVFRYEGNSQFYVIIFDPTASEIEYPVEAGKGVHDNDLDQLPRRRTNPVQIFDEIESDDDSIEILEEIPAAASSSHAHNRRKSAQVDGNRRSIRAKKETFCFVKISPSAHNSPLLCEKKELLGVAITKPFHFFLPSAITLLLYCQGSSGMANTTHSRRRNLVISDAPHFFKVVFFPINRGMKIPTAFMRRYGDNLKKMVWLKVPTGASWPVELLHSDEGTWLHKGWQEFAEYYSIERFHFLVFRYDGSSRFHVVIFNTAASEIEYPMESGHHGMHDRQGQLPRRTSLVRKPEEIYSDDDDDDESIEIVEEISAPCKGKKRGRKSENTHQIGRDDGFVHGLQFGGRIKARGRSALKKSTSIAYQRAKAFKSKCPFFIVFMQPSYVSGSFTVNIPLTFVRDYLTTTQSHLDWELRLSEGKKKWSARCTFHSRNAKIYRGWKEFVVENNLVTGDVCVFELVMGAKIFNVTVYRRC
ncbi:B3 domain-containing transcription factor VRN1 [Coffea arabica]|uniref:B3 domain-containing transcription factor VRN1 n=1 Tax=Coffea arabica TaxID=13443 RepID=A0ABM4V086_COFAR